LFDKYGLDVTLIYLASSAQVAPALISGDIQIAETAGAGIIDARMAGAGIKMVLAYSNYLRFHLYAQKDIRSVADLKGKKAAITRFGSGVDLAMQIILKEAGLKMGTDVGIIQTRSVPEILASVASGVVQAGLLAPPSSFKADQLGLRLLVDTWKYKFPYILAGVAVSDNYLKARPDSVRAFVKAFVEGIAVSKTDKEYTKKVIGKYTKTTEGDILEKTYQEYEPIFEAIPYVPAAAVKAVLDQRAPTIPAAKTANPEDFFDNRFVKELDESGFIRSLYR
ncbi:MAG TPA: ABC transporter substrate-binding protein, partial [bacterium]|nr:ABC transporter substrate-binding protein [bacterium]